MQTLLADTRIALRTLTKNRGFAAVALLTIALGVGANTAVFSVVNAVIIQPLPYSDPDRLVAVFETARRASIERRAVSYPNFLDWQRDARSFEGMSVVLGSRLTIGMGDTPERTFAELVSGGYFELLGVRPMLGRGLTTADDAPGAAPVAVISDVFWRRTLGSDPRILGRRLTINGEPATVVGVMPPGFGGMMDSPLLWVPIARFAGQSIVTDRGQRAIDFVVARLAAGVGIAQAATEMDALAARLDRMYPSEVAERGATITPLRDIFFGGLSPMVLVLFGAVAFVLLIACVNVASLLLARGTARQGEVAVRAALGAGRGRLVRQLLTESVVLSMLGGVAGVLAAFWLVDVLVAMSPEPLPDFVRVTVDLRVLTFAFVVCLASGLLAGLVPAVIASRTGLIAALNMAGRHEGGSAATLRRSFVTVEIALALVLLVGAGLMMRTMRELGSVDTGFRPDGLVTLRLAMPPASADADSAPERLSVFSRTLLEEVRALPGVTSASLSSDVPMGTSTSATNVRIDGRDERVRVYRHLVSPGHFATIGAPLLKGRDFTDDDRQIVGERRVIVSRAMATRHWPAGDALHQRVWRDDQAYEIVGVVGDLQHRQLLESESADPDIYIPIYQQPASAFAVLVRTSADAQSIVTAIRQLLARLDPTVPVFQVETGEQLIGRQTSRVRFIGALLAAFALVALALTTIGIYGVTAYTVSRQTRQVGIRMALGATPRHVFGLVLSGGAAFIAAGLALGTLAALGLTQLLSSLIYGVSATDPATFMAVIVLFALVALLACVVPAVKAMRIDPLRALRTE